MCSLNQIVAEARQLMTRLHDREKLADEAVARGQSLNEKINAMKEYEEEVAELNAVWSCQPRAGLVAGLQAENRQIRGLQAENRQLKLSLEEHSKVLDLVMQRHRQHMLRLPRIESLTALVDKLAHALPSDQGTSEGTMMFELGRVIDQCLVLGEEASHKDQQELTRLSVENTTLRQLLNIASCNDSTALSKFRKLSLDASSSSTAMDTALCNGNIDHIPTKQSSSTSSDDTPTGSPQHNRTSSASGKKVNGHTTIRPSAAKKLNNFYADALKEQET